MSQNSSTCFVVYCIIQCSSERDQHEGKKLEDKNKACYIFLLLLILWLAHASVDKQAYLLCSIFLIYLVHFVSCARPYYLSFATLFRWR